MLLTIAYCPEMNVFTVHNGQKSRIVAPSELQEGQPLHSLAVVFAKAKDAVISGKAIQGICCEV